MESQIKFINPDTGEEIVLEMKTPMTFVYGGNGTGKTTLSRQLDTKLNAVFNLDFVNKNVFVVDENGAKCDPNNKTNFSELFLGEDAVKLAQKVVEMKAKDKDLETDTQNKIKEINNLLDKNNLSKIDDVKNLISQIEYNYSFDENKNSDELKSAFIIKKPLETQIANDSEYEKNLVLSKQSNIKVRVREKISEDPILKLIFVETFDFFEDLIASYNLFYLNLDMIEKAFSKHGNTKKVKEWISNGVTLHENKNECIFCGNKDIEKQISDWKEKLLNKHLTQKDALKKTISDTIQSLNKILSEQNLYNEVTPKIVDTCKKIHLLLSDYLINLDKNEFIKFKTIPIEIDPIFIEAETVSKDLRNYLLNKHLIEIVFRFLYFNSFHDLLQKTVELSKATNIDYAKKTTSIINEMSARLGFTKEVLIQVDNRSTMPKISLNPDNKTGKLSNYSDGQRHKLALSIFFSRIKENKSKFETLLLDDPVISLDVYAYHALKTLLKDKDFIDKRGNLVILTHNIHYLYVQMSNILDNPELLKDTRLFEITPNEIHEVIPALLKYDDVLLFKSLTVEMSDLDDLSCVYWLSSKLARIFLDLRLRIQGNESLGNPGKEIDSLDFSEVCKKDLRKKYSDLAGLCKKKSITVKDALYTIQLMNESIQLLGFTELAAHKSLARYESMISEELPIAPVPKNLKQELVLFAKKLHFSDEKRDDIEEMKHYLNHPRHQITESIFGIRSSKEY